MKAGVNRRQFLAGAGRAAGAAAALATMPASIRRALALPASRRLGTIDDVQHVVVLMMENRSFDHYFGTLGGVRGFADRFPIPLAPLADGTARLVWDQQLRSDTSNHQIVRPFRLDTAVDFNTMRVTGAPHLWSNAHQAWNGGRLDAWPTYKRSHSMAHYGEDDLPFQFALANAFTIADAYHCSFQGGTNPNRVYLFTGTVDAQTPGNGPAIGNLYNNLQGGVASSAYAWTTYPERLEAAGVSWRIYQNMEIDRFDLNPLAGFSQYRAAYHRLPGANPALRVKALSTYDLDVLKDDVQKDRLPMVSWICPTAHGSEHPGPSSPAQGAAYVSEVLDALTANPKVWGSTVLLVMFDENDGFFDHVPPPAAPSPLQSGAASADGFAGASSVDAALEYHRYKCSESDDTDDYLGHTYGLGPRVPMYAISPWSKGGWVSSQVFDHTSVIRFLERRFGVVETNISPWRRAVCGDLTGLFDFSIADDATAPALPATAERADRALALRQTFTPKPPLKPETLSQPNIARRSRALPYRFDVSERKDPGGMHLAFANRGSHGAVLHVYNCIDLDALPRRYTIEAGKSLQDEWAWPSNARYDLWLLGPNGFHRRMAGSSSDPALDVRVVEVPAENRIQVELFNHQGAPLLVRLAGNAYGDLPAEIEVAAGMPAVVSQETSGRGGWYDFELGIGGHDDFLRRVAGRLETGRDSISDPAMHGPAMSA